LPASVRTLLDAVARESGLRDAVHQAYRVQFPAPARAASSPAQRKSRRERSVHLLQGTRRRARDDSGLPLTTAIIATLEGRRVVHLRRVHSR
jgi:hypothetical protein